MTIDEAKKIAGIIATANGGCSCCVSRLCDILNDEFPEFNWEMKDVHYDITVEVSIVDKNRENKE